METSLRKECQRLASEIREANLIEIADSIEKALHESDAATRHLLPHFWLLQAQKHHEAALGQRCVAEIRRVMTLLDRALRDRRMAPETTLRSVFETAADRFRELTGQAEARVTTWQWSKGEVFSLTPHWARRNLQNPGRWLKKAPKTPGSDHWEVGREKGGAVVIAKSRERVSVFQPVGVDTLVYLFTPSGQPVNVHRYYFENRRVVASESMGSGGWGDERYTYEGDAVARIHIRHWSGSRVNREQRLEHDEQGLCSIHEVYPNGARSVLYQRSDESDTIGSLLERIEPLCLPEIRRTLATAGLRGRAFALCLTTESEACCYMPPGVGVGLIDERAKLSDPWFAEEYENFPVDARPDPQLLDLGRRINRLVANDGSGKAVKGVQRLLEALAKTLQRQADTLPLDVDPDFVVYVYDVGGGSGAASVRKLAPVPLRKRLAEHGLI